MEVFSLAVLTIASWVGLIKIIIRIDKESDRRSEVSELEWLKETSK